MDKKEKKVITIPAEEVRAKTGAEKKRLRVAAYCRVSTDEERQLGSFENQIEYFTNLIRENGRYELAAIYSDEGISGTSVRRRPGFQAMIAACEAGEIDLIVTKSISRFARNTQDSLSFTRRLKEIGVGVCFEKEGINTLESSGELLLTLFSCFAQEESRSISENTAWGIRSRFRQGIPHLNTTVLLGYDKGPDGELVINEGQAAVVRRVYRRYLEGASLSGIAGELNRDGIPGVKGEVRWCATTVSRLLQNEKYKGALLMQKTFTANYLTRQHVRNTGQLTQYYIAENHPAIIPPELWEAVQEETARRRAFRAAHGFRGMGGGSASPFYSRFFCARCGRRLQRCCPAGASRPRWQCLDCGRKLGDRELRAGFCAAFNAVVAARAARTSPPPPGDTPLARFREAQMAELTAPGPIPFEVPGLTRAVLREAWLEEEDRVRYLFHTGEGGRVCCRAAEAPL